MEEEGGGGGESRWVGQAKREEESSEEEEEEEGEEEEEQTHSWCNGGAGDSDSGESGIEQRLIRTEPILDSFDVEAMEVPGAHRFNAKVVETRFASHTIVLRRLVRVKEALCQMVISNKWGGWKQVDTEKAKIVKDLIFSDDFWNRVEYALELTEPLMSMLRYADTDEPCLGNIYDAMDSMLERMKSVIQRREQDPDTLYSTVEKIVLHRWNKMTTPLHLLAYALSPRYYSSEILDNPSRVPPYRDPEVAAAYKRALIRLFSDPDVASNVRREFVDFVSGKFVEPDAINDQSRLDAIGWWYLHGERYMYLQPVAIKILSQDLSMGHTLRLAFQTLGVVFGDVGTSPLYVFSGAFVEISEPTEDDVLGALSLILYSLALIPLIKYAFIVLRANDNGEGGTFALYSLICRYAKVSLLPNQQPADAYISTFKLKLPTPELERALIIKECLEKYSILKTLLLILVLIGSSMLVVDGILTPAVSVLSAMRGLKEPVPGLSEDEVLMASIAFLVILFSIQRFGTSKVGVAFGPALFIWFLSLGAIGLYNILAYDKSVFRALNPLYIYYFFVRNSSKAWLSLGGCMLCITGAEAMFADLGHFSVRSIQIAFTFLVFPCLVLAYMGQAAYLIKNPTMAGQAFYASIPAGAFWPVLVLATIAALIASQSMISATFSCIKQSMALGCFPRLKIIHTSKRFMGQIYIPIVNWFLMTFCILVAVTFKSTSKIGNAYGIAEMGVMMVTTVLVTIIMVLIWQTNVFLALSFLVLFLAIELIYFIAVLIRVGDGSWLPLVFASIILLVMYIWNYGSVLKYQSEVQTKVSMDLMLELGSNLGTIRVPGIGLVYNELVHGVPAIFGHFITSLPAIHSTIIFVCIKYIPVPFVSQSQRFLFRRVCPKHYHMFRCIARYGYKDFHKEDHQAFEQLLIESIEKFIRREADELSLESGDDYNLESEDEAKDPRSAGASNGSIDSLEEPLMVNYRKSSQYFAHQESQQEASTSAGLPPSVMSTDDQSLEYELSIINRAKESGVVYLLGHGDIRARKDSWFFKKLVINYFYAFLRKNCRAGIATLSVPHTNLLQVGMTHMV